MNIADEIKRRVTTRQVCETYGIPVNSSGFACCVAHAEKTPSMKVYDGDRGFHCFGCGVGGDVIDFTRILFNISFLEAIQKLNDDFSLGICPTKELSDREKIAIACENFERKKELEKRNKEVARLEAEYWKAFEEWKQYDEDLRQYEPKSPEDEINEKWVVAIKNINSASDRVIEARARWESYAKRNY